MRYCVIIILFLLGCSSLNPVSFDLELYGNANRIIYSHNLVQILGEDTTSYVVEDIQSGWSRTDIDMYNSCGRYTIRTNYYMVHLLERVRRENQPVLYVEVENYAVKKRSIKYEQE